jgi:hypothetical protein
MVHISNRFLDLEPVMAAAAAQGWHARLRYYRPDQVGETYNYTASIWVAMSPSRETLAQLVSANRGEWRPIKRREGFVPWTDDHATLLPLIRWRA